MTTGFGRRWQRLALAGYAVSTLLAFPHELPSGGSVDLGMLFAWLVPAALVVGVDGLAPRRAASEAFVASLVGHALLFHWFFVVTVVYGGMPWALGLLAPLLPALYVSLFTAVFAGIWAWLGSRFQGIGAIVFGAALWVSLDWARAHFLGGFPWATLGYALHLDLPLLGIARGTGVYGLSFVAAAMGLALARVCSGPRRCVGTAWRPAAAVAIAVVLVHGLGWMRPGGEQEVVEDVRIAAIQGNIDQREKWSEERRERILEAYTRLSEEAASRGAQWVVWPETAVPGLLEADPKLSARIGRLVRRSRADFIVGGMGIAPDASGRQIAAFFDSAFVLDRRGRLVDRYDKTQLVPFGEFVPLRGLLGHVFQSLATGMAHSDVTPGRAPRVSLIDGGPNARPPLRVGIPICYELIFPHRVRRFAAGGAGVLLAITNDAWYGRTGAPHQFLAMTALRAAENGRWVIRAANTGISAIIDARGRVRAKTPLFEEAVLVADVPVVRSGGLTFYAQYGDVFAWGCLGWVLAGTGWALIQGGRTGPARRGEGRIDES